MGTQAQGRDLKVDTVAEEGTLHGLGWVEEQSPSESPPSQAPASV